MALDRAHARFFVWVAVSVGLSALAAPNFLSLLGQSLNDTFGNVFPAIPFAALLTVLFLVRWGGLHEILIKEKGLTSEPAARMAGLVVIAGLLILRNFVTQSVVLSGVAVILTFYGSSLALIPSARMLILPYALTYAAGVAVPFVLQWAFGEPLVTLSSDLSAWVVSLTGVPITWQGAQFSLVSKTGDLVSATVTPGCSSIISITTFLGLLALMHFDMRKALSSTVKLAVAGVAALTLLNSVRIAILIWVGYSSGAAALWGIHNWVGYFLFLGFYVVALLVYTRMKSSPVGSRSITTERFNEVSS
jgi:exosortase/archaeosortase family protein